MRWQARRRSPNRLGNPRSAGERPKPHVAGPRAAPDRQRAMELNPHHPPQDLGWPRRSQATVPPAAGARSLCGGRSPADARSGHGTRSVARSRSPRGGRFPATARCQASGRSQAGTRSRAAGRCQALRFLPGARLPATVPWPAIAQSPAAGCPAVGLAPDCARRAMAQGPPMAAAPRLRARTRSVAALAARSQEPGDQPHHPRASPARPRPRTRLGGLGPSSRAWLASCLP